MKPQHLSTLLENAHSQDQRVNELLNKLKYDFSLKQWHQYGETIIELIYQCRDFDASNLIQSTIHQLNTSLDIYVILEILEVFLNRNKLPIEQCIEMIEKQESLVKNQPITILYMSILKSKFYLLFGHNEKAFNLFIDTEKDLKNYRTFPKIIFSSLNEVKSQYYWSKQDFQNYIQTTLNYLAYKEHNKFTKQEKILISSQVVISLLLCKSSLNFGEVVTKEFFYELKSSDQSYLWTLVEIFNRGNVDEYNEFKKTEFWKKNVLMQNNLDVIENKIRVISLYDKIFFSGQFNKQHISFQEISHITKLDKLQVERLIIHVLSIKLMEGYIDEPNEMFYIQSLKPRELDIMRIHQLKEKFMQWNQNVENTKEQISSYQLDFIHLIIMIEQLTLFMVLTISACTEGTQAMIKPIMYGTSIVLAFVGFFVVYWMYGMNYEKDPMIYSKFLSVKKNKQFFGENDLFYLNQEFVQFNEINYPFHSAFIPSKDVSIKNRQLFTLFKNCSR